MVYKNGISTIFSLKDIGVTQDIPRRLRVAGSTLFYQVPDGMKQRVQMSCCLYGEMKKINCE